MTSSYNELRRFRCSAAVSAKKAKSGLGTFDSTTGLVQVVADNFDPEIFSQNALLWTVAWPASPIYVPDFVSHVVADINQRCKGSAVAHVVFDRYNDMSIKSQCWI